MPLIGNTFPTLKDKYSQMENGKVTSTIIEMLTETNVILEDAVTVECNEGSSHKTTVRNGLPEAEFRMFYQGVKCSKSSYTQMTDTTSMLEVYSEVDKALADLNADKNQFRLNESKGFVEAMNETVQKNIFYGSKANDPRKFDGFAIRYNKISADKKSIGHRVISATPNASGNNFTSMYFITWGDLHTHLLYPKGSQAGLKHEDKGQQTKTVADESGNTTMFEIYRDHYKWDIGMSLRDYRSSGRICNILPANIGVGDDKINLINLMIDLYYRIKRYAKTGKTVIYCNEDVIAALHKLAKDSVYLTLSEFEGKPIVSFLGIPIKCCDQVLVTEAAVA